MRQKASWPRSGVSVLRLAAALVGAVLLGAALGGCSKSADAVRAAHNDSQPRRAQSDSAELPLDADMVSAVSASTSTTPIALKFRIAARPQIGQPLQIVLALLPASGVQIDHIHASISVSEGLQLQSERSFDPDPSAGATLQQAISVLPQRAGVLNVMATIVVDSNQGSIARSYSIPVIVADNAS